MIAVNIIHDPRRIERYEPLINELFRQNIKGYKIWEPVEDTRNVVRSINLSHKQIVRWAKDLHLPEVAILEDDVMFPAKDGWQYFLSKKPLVFDIYTACNYLPTLVIHDGLAAAPSLVGFHCYIIRERYYDAFLSLPDDKHVDQIQDGMKYQLKICHPFAALQRKGFSSNNMAVCDYNSILKQEDIYT